MRIEGIETSPVRCTLNKEGWRADGEQYGFWPSHMDFVIVRVHASGGLLGIGEAAAAPWYYGSTVQHNLRLLQLYEEAIKGEDPRNLAKIHKVLDVVAGSGFPTPLAAKDAIDMALLDLAGKALGLPVYTLLGGAFRTEFELMTNLYLQTPELMGQRVKEYVDRGFKGIKVKCGNEVERRGWSLEVMATEVGKIKAALAVAPPNVYLDADANQAWGSARRVITVVNSEFRGCTNLAIEQPIRYADLAGLRQIAESISLPLILDETVISPEFLVQAILAGAARDRIVVKPVRVGGLTPARRCIVIAEAAGIGVSIDSAPYTRIGDTAVCHLAATVRDPYPLEAECHTWFDEDPVKRGGVTLDGGLARISADPGLGLELDESAIKAMRIRDL